VIGEARTGGAAACLFFRNRSRCKNLIAAMSLGSPNRKRVSRQSPQKRKLSITLLPNARYQLGKLSDNSKFVNGYVFSELIRERGESYLAVPPLREIAVMGLSVLASHHRDSKWLKSVLRIRVPP